jgi:hypothetical protein
MLNLPAHPSNFAGAPYYDIPGTTIVYSVGIAYLYSRPDITSNFAVLQTLTQPSAAAYDYFGYSVAISGGTVFVAAPGHESTDSKILDHGTVFVFTLAKGTYSVSATLMDSTPTSYDQFGFTTSGKLALKALLIAFLMRFNTGLGYAPSCTSCRS